MCNFTVLPCTTSPNITVNVKSIPGNSYESIEEYESLPVVDCLIIKPIGFSSCGKGITIVKSNQGITRLVKK